MGIQSISSSSALDLTSLLQSQSTGASTSASQKPAGAPSAGGGGSTQAASSSSSSSSSSAKIYDVKDTNKDGVVSYMEELLYSMENPTVEAETNDQPAVSSSQMQSGLSAYQQNQQSNDKSSSLLLAA